MVAGVITAIPIGLLVMLVGMTDNSWWSILLTFVVGLAWSLLILHVGIIVEIGRAHV